MSEVSNFKASAPPPLGSTENSSLEKQTVGGQQIKVKHQDAATSVKNDQVFMDEVEDNKVGKTYHQFTDPGKPGEPKLPAAGPYKPEAVQQNEWLNSTFMVSIAVSLTAVAMLNKEIHKAEGIWTVQALTFIWKSALSLAELIMAKAEKEAAMHMALAIGAMASLGVAVGGTALSIGGKTTSTSARNRMAELDEGITPPPKPTTTQAGAQPGSVAPNTPGPTVAERRANAYLPDNAPNPPPKSVAAKNVVVNDQGNAPGALNTTPPSTNATSIKADIKTTKNKPAQDLTPEQRVTERQALNKKDARGENLHMVGMAMTQATPAVGQIIENLIQMYYKPEIAYIEQQIELERAMKELWQKSWDTALQGFNGAGQEIDSAMQNWTKEQDENTRAHMLKGG